MTHSLKIILFLISTIPLLIKLPYLISSWIGSPYERYDAVIWLALPFVAFVCEYVRQKVKITDTDKKTSVILIGFIGLLLFAFVVLGFNFNALGIVLAIGIVAISTDLLFGHKVLLAQVPTIFFALLTIPNLSFWFNYCFNQSILSISAFFFAKIILGCAFFVAWILCTLFFKRYPRVSSIVFCMCAFATIIFAEIRDREIPVGDVLMIDIKKIKAGKWIGVDVPENQLDKRLFASAKQIKRKIYYDDNSNVALLAIDVGDIADIHPIEICMQSAGIVILESRQIYLMVEDKKIQLNELIMEVNNQKFCAYSFFVNEEFSTGYFTKFRLSDSAKVWRHYQMITPIEKDETAIRERIKDLLRNMLISENQNNLKLQN